jgi:hypothetical protein
MDIGQVVKWVGTFVFVLTLLVLLLVILLRVALLFREKRRQSFLNIWQPILINAIEMASADVPQLARRDLPDFLLLWNHLHESVLDESKDHLNQIGRALRIDQSALRMLRSRNLRYRLLGIVTLGELREPVAWDALLEIVNKEGPLLSVVAAHALVMIDAPKAVPLLIPLLVKRPDWPASRVSAILQTAGADIASDQIARAVVAFALQENENADVVQANPAARVIRYLELAYDVSALPAVRTIVESSGDPEVLAACLRFLESAEDLPIVRDCLTHEDWRVRVQAASALGRIGQAEDEPGLITLLSDEEWWVRYRAAQALSRLPLMVESKLKAIQIAQSDRFARDMLAQVMAEVQLQ